MDTLSLPVRKADGRIPSFRLITAACVSLALGATYFLSKHFSLSSNGPNYVNGVQTLENVNASGAGIGLVAVTSNGVFSVGSTLGLNWWPTGCTLHPEEDAPPAWTIPESSDDAVRPGCGYKPDVLNIMMDGSRQYYINSSDEHSRGSFLSFGLGDNPETFSTFQQFSVRSAKDKLMIRDNKESRRAWYPFDTYKTSVTIEAFSDRNATQPLPIHFIQFSHGQAGSIVSMRSIEHAKTTRTDQAIKVYFTARRSFYIKFIAMGLFTANHVLAAAMLSVAVRAQTSRPLPQSALFLPLASALLLPQLRNAMPDLSTGFGGFTGLYYIDTFGYYVDIVAAIIAATIMVFKIFGNNNFERISERSPQRGTDEKRLF